MQIPNEVLDSAESARRLTGLYDSYTVIAEWARKEALKEVVEALDEPGLTDLIANAYANEFHDPGGHAARAIRSLVREVF